MNPLNPLTNPRTPADALAIAAAAIEAAPTPTRVKRLEVKIFAPGNKRFARRSFVAAPHHVLTEEGIDERLDAIAEEIEKTFPGHDYRLVPIDAAAFNFIHCDDCKVCAAGQERAA